MLTLDVAISTYKKDGILRVEKMLNSIPETPGVNFVVSWQEHENASVPPSLINRKDVNIYRFDEKGLSRNRNNSIACCKADIVLLSDDDMILYPKAFKTIIKRFEDYPDTQIASFMKKEQGKKKYPPEVRELSFYLPNGYNICSCEIAIRREVFEKIKFNNSFGIGSGIFEVGEDELFHLEARKKGIKCTFFPDIIGSHPHEATGGKKIEDKRVLQGYGVIITKSYPRSYFLRIPLKAFRIYRKRRYKFWGALYQMLKGITKSRQYVSFK